MQISLTERLDQYVRLTAAALHDLEKIGRYTAQRRRVAQRNHYLKIPDVAYHQPAAFPEPGKSNDAVYPGLRCYNCQKTCHLLPQAKRWHRDPAYSASAPAAGSRLR